MTRPAFACHADQLITRRLREALQLVDIRVLDHLIVAGSETLSFAERGFFDMWSRLALIAVGARRVRI